MILTGNHVCHNPRAYKEAEALSEAGYEVEWLGAWLLPGLAERDRRLLAGRKWRYTPVTDWTADTRPARIRRQWQRARRLMGAKWHKHLRWENVAQLGYCAWELLREARRRDPQLYIAHSEQALWVADRLQREGRCVGVDMEDWFSEDPPAVERRERPVHLVKTLERSLLQSAGHLTCTSEAMSRKLQATYHCKAPVVVHNAFPWRDRLNIDGQTKDRVDRSVPSVYWFSQVIAPARGLEDLCAALALLPPDFEVHLRGALSDGNRRWIEELLPPAWKSRVFLHPVVHNDELLSRIVEHDIGLAIEPNYPPNKDLTVSNKMLHYLVGGLAVVASDTTGQREIAAQAPAAVRIYPSGDARALAERLQSLCRAPSELAAAKSAALEVAERKFCWEKVAPKIIESVRALHARSEPTVSV